jgi:hypothetical protein
VYHQKIIVEDAVPINLAVAESDPVPDEASIATRLMALLVIAALPFVIVAFIVRFVWSDVKSIGRGLKTAFRAITEELSRKA